MRAKVLILLALLAIASSVSAQAPMMSQTTPWVNSFRNQSTARLLEDNLDLMLGRWGYLDPARIDLIEGRHLYTNLANIYTKNEEQFSNSGAETYVVGGNTDIFGYGKLGLLYSRNKVLQSDSTASDNVHMVDIDPGTNPGYDYRQTQKLSDKWIDQVGESDYYLGWAKQVSDMRLGLAFKRSSYSYQYDERHAEDIVNQNITAPATVYTQNSMDTTSEKNSSSENWFGGSVWKPLNDKMDVSLRLALGMGGFENINEYSYTYNDAYPGGDSYGETEDSTFDSKYSGTAFSMGGAYVYKWTEAMNTRFDLQFTHLGYKPDGSIAWDYKYHDQSLSVNSDYNDDSYTDAVDGKYSQNTIDFRVVNTAKLEKAVFAIGLGFKTEAYELTETHERASVDRYEYRLNNDATLPASYVQTASWGETWEYKNTGADYTITLPVAVEFDMTKKICFRLGATHYISNSEGTNNETLTGGSAVISTTTVHGDGTRATTYTPNPLDDQTGTSETGKGQSSYTDYTYGAGWKVTENLQLDFMGFAKLTDLTNWKLSAVFKF